MKTAKVAPAKNMQVRDPDTFEILPASGKEVTLNPYWVRRINVGDVELVQSKTKASETNKKGAGA